MADGFEMVAVAGHAPQTEHVEGGWRATCACGYQSRVYDSVDLANEKRFAHEDKIGLRVAATYESPAEAQERLERELAERLRNLA